MQKRKSRRTRGFGEVVGVRSWRCTQCDPMIISPRIFPILLLLQSCVSVQKKNLMKLPEALHSENYVFTKTNSIKERVQVPKKIFVEYVAKMDNNPKYKAYELSRREMDTLTRHAAFLPKKLSACILENEVNLVFIENFMGGGMVQFTVSQSGKLSAFIILNPKLLTMTMQDWYEYRDNSPFFQGTGNIRVKVPIGKTHKAILGILIHEAAHTHDLFNNVTPYVDPELMKLGFATDAPTPFIDDVWLGFSTPRADFEGRLMIRSYGLGDRLDSVYIPYLYESLGKSPFITLYGSSYWSEDYAETYTWCYLKQGMSIEYSVHAYKGNEKLFSFFPLRDELSEKRCNSIQ